jgi:hypothetical protein
VDQQPSREFSLKLQNREFRPLRAGRQGLTPAPSVHSIAKSRGRYFALGLRAGSGQRDVVRTGWPPTGVYDDVAMERFIAGVATTHANQGMFSKIVFEFTDRFTADAKN